MRIGSYPKVLNIGHSGLFHLLDDPVIVQEKVDGSQFSFGVLDGELVCRSRGRQINTDAPDNLFAEAVETVRLLEGDLTPGWIYRGEVLKKPNHNALTYNRVPKGHVVLFDINPGLESYLPYDDVVKEGERLGLEVVPIFFEGMIKSVDMCLGFMENESFLGGPKIEGVVIKNYSRFGQDGKAIMGKYVSEAFKEVHKTSWKEKNPSQKDVIRKLIGEYRTEPRWHKAMQHIAERGELLHEPKDIGGLVKEVQADILEECEEEIKQALFDWAWPHIRRGVSSGCAEWYKRQLLERQFDHEKD